MVPICYACAPHVTQSGLTAPLLGEGVLLQLAPQCQNQGCRSLSAVLAYMQLLEDYSEPQPSVFYQTPQNEHVYQQKNKLLMEVYGFNDSFSSADPQDLAPPPALPPKQRQLVSGPSQVPSLLPGQQASRNQKHLLLLGAGAWAGVEPTISHVGLSLPLSSSRAACLLLCCSPPGGGGSSLP